MPEASVNDPRIEGQPWKVMVMLKFGPGPHNYQLGSLKDVYVDVDIVEGRVVYEAVVTAAAFLNNRVAIEFEVEYEHIKVTKRTSFNEQGFRREDSYVHYKNTDYRPPKAKFIGQRSQRKR